MQIHDFAPLPALAGGALIGLSATMVLLTHGRIAGISGIFARTLRGPGEAGGFDLPFLLGLFASGLGLYLLMPGAFAALAPCPLGLVGVAGLLVGFGTRAGGGCTSGHGVCGLSRFSLRSLVATLTFMAAGAATVFVMRHALAGAP